MKRIIAAIMLTAVLVMMTGCQSTALRGTYIEQEANGEEVADDKKDTITFVDGSQVNSGGFAGTYKHLDGNDYTMTFTALGTEVAYDFTVQGDSITVTHEDDTYLYVKE